METINSSRHGVFRVSGVKASGLARYQPCRCLANIELVPLKGELARQVNVQELARDVFEIGVSRGP